MNNSGRYWDKPWGLVSSCTRCSPGCRSCWALALEKRFHRGEEGTVVVHPEKLDIPLRRKKPTVYSIWNDLFHEDVPDEFRNDVYAVMHGCSDRHTYLILTKRADNLLRFMRDNFLPVYQGRDYIWHGVTVCNQAEADEKIPLLLRVPGKKWLSIEPMLGPVNLVSIPIGKRLLPLGKSEPLFHNCLTRRSYFTDDHLVDVPKIDAVILGGETSTGARPLHPDWVRSVRDQCQAAGVPFYFKQWGEWGPKAGDGKYAPQCFVFGDGLGDVPVFRVGSKRAGRLLDGREWNELAWIK